MQFKMASITKLATFLFMLYFVKADDIDNSLRKGVMLKLLREMVNQTSSDTLNLPANSTSIRENITDTFKCENRTYGYYADVDNDCQIFHVCLTSQAYSGRNVTYRWSFICPNETIFNQEVLTCTRPRDAIDCKDSPMYYDVNMDIGKITNDSQNEPNSNINANNNNSPNHINKEKDKVSPNVEMIKVSNRKKNNNRKKQNIIQDLMEEVKDVIKKENIKELYSPVVEETVMMNEEVPIAFKETVLPVAVEEIHTEVEEKPTKIEYIPIEVLDMNTNPVAVKEIQPMNAANTDEIFVEEVKPIVHDIIAEKEMPSKKERDAEGDNSRLNMERSLKRRGKKFHRGTFRFKADVY